MIRIIVAAAMLAASVAAANAACPRGTVYQCHPTFNGKMQCGCY